MFSLRTIMTLGVVLSLALAAGPAAATPLPGEVLAFEQLPLNGGLAPSAGGAPYAGHSELSTVTPGQIIGYSGTYMGDDFSITTSDPIYRVEWWGSYLNSGNGNGVQRFLLSFETDVPATGNTPSHPGTPVISQIVSKGPLAAESGTFTETAIATAAGATGPLYHYSAELELPMLTIVDQVYWLKIVAIVNPNTDGSIAWGWQDRDYSFHDGLASTIPVPGEHTVPNGLGLTMNHFQDDAVTGGITMFQVPQTHLAAVQQTGYTPQTYLNASDGPTGISAYGKDLAFLLYTVPVPEPTTLVLLGMGGVALAAAIRRRRRR